MSKQWSNIVFQKDDENYIESCRTVQGQFHEILMSSGYPEKMALFCREDTPKTETFYFSPDCNHYAQEFLKRLPVIPCDQPDHVGLILLEGNTASRTSIFGEKARIEIPTRRHKPGK